jgi:hypothetical protein
MSSYSKNKVELVWFKNDGSKMSERFPTINMAQDKWIWLKSREIVWWGHIVVDGESERHYL